MPIHNLGYRPWNGELGGTSTRWLVVAEIGIRRAWLSAWLRRMMFFAWVPGVMMGFMIFMFEQFAAGDRNFSGAALLGLSQVLLDSGTDVNVQQKLLDLTSRPYGEQQHVFWSMLLLSLFKRSQPFILIPVVGVIAPSLISQDFRSRAFLLYFSRPLSKVQYILGKAATVMFFLSMITMVPALLLFCTGVSLSQDLTVLRSTWDLPIRIVFASAMIIVPSTSLALMLSSLTTESRYAAFGWFAIWIFGHLTYLTVISTVHDSDSILHCLSLFNVFSDVAAWTLDPEFQVSGIETRFILLAILTAVSLVTVYRRVSAPMQI